VGLVASLDRNGKSRSHRDLIFGPSTNYTILAAMCNSKRPKFTNFKNILQRIKQIFGLFVCYFFVSAEKCDGGSRSDQQ
jgi:hypothetical protein